MESPTLSRKERGLTIFPNFLNCLRLYKIDTSLRLMLAIPTGPSAYYMSMGRGMRCKLYSSYEGFSFRYLTSRCNILYFYISYRMAACASSSSTECEAKSLRAGRLAESILFCASLARRPRRLSAALYFHSSSSPNRNQDADWCHTN
jgi:hypothetical protein